ncbi:hypothetical protein L1887_02765 [Cichorium endivia]|nr:hypothetical protein L1887_02765 [Cichorium endivia]
MESPIPIASPVESPMPGTSDKVCWLGWWMIHIYDAMKDPITVHIQSKEDDLGNRTIAFNGSTNWKFCLSSYARTRFYAHFYWNSRTAFFDVYDYDTASTYCAASNTFKQQNCFWTLSTNFSNAEKLTLCPNNIAEKAHHSPRLVFLSLPLALSLPAIDPCSLHVLG